MVQPMDATPKRLEFGFELALLVLLASFALVPEEHQRNWLLYVTALSGFGFLAYRAHRLALLAAAGSLCLALLLLMPLLSMLWSEPGVAVSTDALRDSVKEKLVAAVAIVGVYIGLSARFSSPAASDARLKTALLWISLVGVWLALGYWWLWIRPTAKAPRFEGALGFGNPVHAAILAFGCTLPALHGAVSGRSTHQRWLLTAALLTAFGFGLVAGARMAVLAYILIVAVLCGAYRPRWLLLMGCFAAVVLGLVATIVGIDALTEIWLSRGLSYRLDIWGQVWEQSQDCQPLIGCGLIAPLTIVVGPAMGDRAHSLFLALYYHQGLLGLLVFGGVCTFLMARVRRTAQAGWAWMLAFALLANATSGDQILLRATPFWLYFWVPLLMLASVQPGKLATSPALSSASPGRS